MTYDAMLASMAAADERLVVMTAENRVAIRNLPPLLGGRFIDVGICEQTLVGMAAGLALRGRIPVVHALATFLVFRAYEFIRDDIAIPSLPVKLVGGVPGFLSDGNGPTHQAMEDIALMRGLPPMNVFCPADAEELVAGMPAIIRDPAPWYVRYNAAPASVGHTGDFAIGKAEVFGEGTDVAILTFGFLLREVVVAAGILRSAGIGVRILNLRTLKPADEEAMLAAVRETGLVVTVEDHFLTGGLHSILAELCLRHRCTPRVLPISPGHRWFTPALLPDVLHTEGFTGDAIAARIRQAIDSVPSP